MSTQSEREVAARAWWKSPGHDSAQELVDATETQRGHAGPNPKEMGTILGALSAWLAWAKANAANAANADPAAPDPLEGVVFTTPGAVLAWAEQAWDKARPKPIGFAAMGVSSADGDALWSWLRTNDASGNGWPEHVGAIAARARAQLAREAAAAEDRLDLGTRPTPTAPVAPAVTLEDATTAALAAELERRGGTVTMPKVGGYDEPAKAMTAAMAWAALCNHDRAQMWSTIMRHADNAEAIGLVATLTNLGVTPAVLK